MPEQDSLDLETFRFRGLHPYVFLGTASDRYAGWIGQIYTPDRYRGRITSRRNRVGGQTFQEKVLPVESVREYFEHFGVLELDFTFYRYLLEPDGRPTQNYHVLREYRQYLHEGDRLILKVPQAVFAQKLLVGGRYVDNPTYLDAEAFTRRFYEPAVQLLGNHLHGLVFEQEYQRRQGRDPAERIAEALDRFFGSIPEDARYHVELRTESFLAPPVLSVLKRHGVGQVLSHWTWLPSLRSQFHRAGKTFTSARRDCVLRLLTPRGMRYEEAYARAHPFDRLVEGMMSRTMIKETVELMWRAVQNEVRIHVIVNNRAGGNAPLIARQIATRFLSTRPRGP